MTEELDGESLWKWPWMDIISLLGSLLTVLGFAFYAVSNSAYAHFYSSLGTTPPAGPRRSLEMHQMFGFG